MEDAIENASLIPLSPFTGICLAKGLERNESITGKRDGRVRVCPCNSVWICTILELVWGLHSQSGTETLPRRLEPRIPIAYSFTFRVSLSDRGRAWDLDNGSRGEA